MITVDTIRKCSFLSSTTLEGLLRKNYPKDVVIKSDFVGITNGGQFCYNIMYFDDIEGENRWSKAFVWQDNNGDTVADY